MGERQVVVADCIVGLAPTDPKAELAGPHCSLICILLRKLRVVKVASGGIHAGPYLRFCGPGAKHKVGPIFIKCK